MEDPEMAISAEEQTQVTALVKAAYEGRLAEVIRLVESRPVLMDRWDFLRRSFNALMAAAEENQVDVIRYLVGRGARLDLQSGSGWTALMYAADRGHDEIVTFLLESGADASACGKDGRTALILASSNYYAVGSVKILLEWKRQDVDARDARGATALWWASYWANFEAIRHLLAGGADQTIADAKGRTPKQIARKEGHDGCVGLIEWWEAEMVRKPFVLERARCVEECSTIHGQCPRSPPPIYLFRRADSGRPFPSLSLVPPRQAGGLGLALAASPEKAEGHAARPRRRRRSVEEEDMIGESGEGPTAKAGGGKGKGRRAGEGEEERAATVEFLVKGLPSELFTELLGGLRWRAGNSVLLPGKAKRAKGEGTPIKDKDKDKDKDKGGRSSGTPSREKGGGGRAALATP